MAKQATIVTLDEALLPEWYHRADKASIATKGQYNLLLRTELTLVVLAACAQVVSHPFGSLLAQALHLHIGEVDALMFSVSAPVVTSAVASAIIPGIFITLAVVATVARYMLRLDERWHAQRALAEMVRELAWRYCMRALPGDIENPMQSDANGDDEYVTLLQDLTRNPPDLAPPSPDDTQERASWERMQALRKRIDLAQRRDAYVEGRLTDQRMYYSGHAQTYHARRNKLRWFMVGCYVVGGLLLPVNGLGAMTTMAGAIGSWLTGQQYEVLYQSYGKMTSDLTGLINLANEFRVGDPEAAQKWTTFVNGVEKLFEGERRDWKRHADQNDRSPSDR